MKDESVLVGKVKYKSKKIVVLKNSYGVFRIQRKFIKKGYITRSYKRDVAIQKKLGITVNEEAIKKNYYAGKGEKPRKEREERDSNKIEISSGWNNGRLTLAGTRLQSTGKMKDVIPYGYGGFAAYDHGAGSRYFLIPGLRLEGGYIHFKKDDSLMKGPVCSGGLTWLIPFVDRSYGNIILTGTAGMSFLEFEKNSKSVTSNTFTAWGSAGYEFSFGPVLFQCQARYMFVFDEEIDIHGVGGLMGLGFKLY